MGCEYRSDDRSERKSNRRSEYGDDSESENESESESESEGQKTNILTTDAMFYVYSPVSHTPTLAPSLL